MTDKTEVMVGGKGFFDWINHLYNSIFGSIFGYTDTVKLGGRRKTRVNPKFRYRNKTHKNVK
jgi:hypothetical protein